MLLLKAANKDFIINLGSRQSIRFSHVCYIVFLCYITFKRKQSSACMLHVPYIVNDLWLELQVNWLFSDCFPFSLTTADGQGIPSSLCVEPSLQTPLSCKRLNFLHISHSNNQADSLNKIISNILEKQTRIGDLV